MKLFGILIACVLFPWAAAAQEQTEYNRKGDEALQRKDYRDAKMWFEEGVSYCDPYSIGRLTEIWLADERMRPSMRSLMGRCLNCLNVRGMEQDTTAMRQLILYYENGIGTRADGKLSRYWVERLAEVEKPAGTIPYTPARPEKKRGTMDFFAGFHYSPEAPYGLTIGGMKKRLGWYARFKTNMGFDDYAEEYSEANGGEITGLGPGQSYRFTGDKKKNCYAATAGMLARLTGWLYASMGFGYGSRALLYEYRMINYQTAAEGETAWAKHMDASEAGVAAECDMVLKFGRFFVSAGCCTLNFKYADLNAGIGVFF